MSLQANVSPAIAKTKPYGPGIGNAARELRGSSAPFGNSVADALEALQQRTDSYEKALRSDGQTVREILVTDSTGKVIGAVGSFVFQGVRTTNYFSEIHVGDPLGTGDPSKALFNAADGRVTVGQHGWLDVLDPYGADAAWIGTQYDTLTVTGAVASATTPLIRLTIVGHPLATGDVVQVLNIGGVPNATGVRTVTKIDADHFDLQSTVFVGAFTSGGTVDRLLHVTGAANNGAGLIRLTVTAHGYESGDKVNIQTVGGVPNATGQWIVTVITANTFDLVGSTFAGAYTSGGTSLRYFAGGLFQTVAVGPSFANYKLRAFADGTLRLKDALITLNGSGAAITMDPTAGTITVVANSMAATTVTIQDGITLTWATDGSDTQIQPGRYSAVIDGIGSEATSEMLNLGGFSGATAFGPLLGLHQYRGSAATPTATQSGDTLGGMVGWGFDGTGESAYAAGVRMVATQNHALTAHGTKLTFEVTPNGGTATATPMTLDQDGTLNVAAAYKVAGTQVVTTRQAAVTAISLTAGATYAVNEQNMLSSLKTAVNALISRLQTHGLTS